MGQLIIDRSAISDVSWPLIGWAVPTHLQSRRDDRIEFNFYLVKSLWGSPSLINFWTWSTKFLAFHNLWLIQQFPYICRQAYDLFGIKPDGTTHYGLQSAWITFDHAPLNSRCLWHVIGRRVSVHLQTKNWSDAAQIWWTNLLWSFSGVINFWSCSAESQIWFPATFVQLPPTYVVLILFSSLVIGLFVAQ